ncbi:MAG: hypothetical protein R6W67_00575 [Bacteroidales bacterium]
MKQKADILHSILRRFDDCIVFLHNTRKEEIAVKILFEGFVFENQFSHTSDRINPDEQIEIAYFLFQRKDYGPYTIVIAIPKTVYSLYTRYSNQLHLSIEELMSKEKPFMSDNDELVYCLPPEHIAGYFNNETNEFRENPKYNSGYISYRDRDSF